MKQTNPTDIIQFIHQMRSGLVVGLITKEEVIEWAESIVTTDKTPDIFFIDLVLLSSKSNNEIINYLGEYLNFDGESFSGRPLFHMLNKRMESKDILLSKVINTLYRIANETKVSDYESYFIYTIENDHSLAIDNITGELTEIDQRLRYFLRTYKDYTFENFNNWSSLDKVIDHTYRLEKETSEINNESIVENIQRKWWQFWK